jgi:hypothetical protein
MPVRRSLEYKRKPLRYHLRYQILPGPNAERDARTLAKFCREHGVEEVVLFFAAEEWNNGLLSKKEETVWFRTVARSKEILEKAGVTCSLNPWPTILHREQGRHFPKDRRFSPAVSPTGEVSKAMGGFADPEWREYLWSQYGRFAKLGLRILWIEDDFRYHGHHPLTWGGGFEPEMLEKFAAKIGRAVTREEVVRNVLKPGKPHPWRREWLATWREAQLEVAAGLAKAVAANAPGESRLGLMSGSLTQHAWDGRDWVLLLDKLSINGKVAHRPWFGSNGVLTGDKLWQSTILLDTQRNFEGPGCEVAPELENYPFLRWGKADAMTWAQMAVCLAFGSDAILMDIFPFAGNPANSDPEVGAMMDKCRPGLEWIAARFDREWQTAGVGVPWRQDAQEHVRTLKGESFNELDADFFPPAHYLIPYGVPLTARAGQPVQSVFGSLMWAFADDEVREMLRGGLLLDSASAAILCERGFSREIGLTFGGMLERTEHDFSVEETLREVEGCPSGFYFHCYRMPRMGVLKPLRGAQEWTRIITAERKYVGAGMVAFENKLGGRVVTQAVPDTGAVMHGTYQRQALVHEAVRFLSRNAFASPLVGGSAHMQPIHLRRGDANRLIVINGSPDAATPTILMPKETSLVRKATLLTPLEKPKTIGLRARKAGNQTAIGPQKSIPYLSFLVVEW